MSRNQAVQSFAEDLSVSHSQIFCYTACSLKYRFQYVEQRPPERISINLPFGRAIHSAMETAYRSLKNKGQVEPVTTIVQVFEETLNLDLDAATVPIVYKKTAPDRPGALALGKAMLEVFHDSIVRTVQTAQIVEVELPLSARLYTDEGQPTEFKLVGILDLLDSKTAARKEFIEHEEFLAVREAALEYLKTSSCSPARPAGESQKSRNLAWSQVDRKQGIVRLEVGETKTDDGRKIYVDTEVKAILQS